MKLLRVVAAAVLALGLSSVAAAPATACEEQPAAIWFACC